MMSILDPLTRYLHGNQRPYIHCRAVAEMSNFHGFTSVWFSYGKLYRVVTESMGRLAGLCLEFAVQYEVEEMKMFSYSF
jgi:hypothetical protein